MSDDEELGSDNVSARTRAFEEIDAQVFPGPGRGATRSEAAASDRWGGPLPATVEAYRRMFDLVVKHGLAPQPAMSRHHPGATAERATPGEQQGRGVQSPNVEWNKPSEEETARQEEDRRD